MPIVGDAAEGAGQLTDLELAYMAGFVDGEGCVSVATRLKIYMTPTVQVSNTNQAVLQWFLAAFGGEIDVRRDHRPTRKQCNTWRVAGDKARRVLRALLPFLRVKKRQAELALSYSPKGRGYKRTPQDVEQVKTIILQIRALNKRGVSHAA